MTKTNCSFKVYSDFKVNIEVNQIVASNYFFNIASTNVNQYITLKSIDTEEYKTRFEVRIPKMFLRALQITPKDILEYEFFFTYSVFKEVLLKGFLEIV